jgi:hypothetical protein
MMVLQIIGLCPRRRANRAPHALRPPRRLMKLVSVSFRSLNSVAYRSARDHLLRVLSFDLVGICRAKNHRWL